MSRIFRINLGSAANLAGLDTVSPGPARRYRRTVGVTIPTGGLAQRMEVLPNSVLDVTFAARSFDAAMPGAPETAQLFTGQDGLVVRMPVARRIARVRLTTFQAGDEVAAFRFDGRVVSDDPVASVAHLANGAALGVTDTQLILRRRRGGADLGLAPTDVAEVIISVDPVLPRVSFAIVGDAEGEVALPPATDGTGAPIFPTNASWGPRLAQILTTQLTRFAEGRTELPDTLLVDLVLEADTPCSAAIDAFDFGYVLEREGFSGSAEKQVLRFAAGRRETRCVSLDLPPNITVVGASLHLTWSGAGAPTTRRQGVDGPGVDLPSAVQHGVEIAPRRLVAASLLLGSAAVITGADVLLGVVEGPAEATASLWEEADGLPAGRLQESVPVSVVSARPVVVSFAFVSGIAVPAGPVWLCISAGRGRVVLGLVPPANGPAATGSIATGDGTVWSVVSSVAGKIAAAHLRQAAPERTEMADGSGLVLSLSGTKLPLSSDGRTRVVDFADHLNAMPAPRPAHVMLEVQTSGAIVTIEPPVLRYSPE